MRSIQSINKMPVATFEGNNIKWNEYENSQVNGIFKVHSDLELKVAQIKIMPGLDSELLFNLAKMGYKGIVIEAYGAGGIPLPKRNKEIL